MELEEFVRKVLLDNAIKYDGTANPKAAMGAIMREFPEYRGKAGDLMPMLLKLANEINALNVNEQQKLLEELGGADAPEKEEVDPFALTHPKPVLRFEPSPSGPMHIGHAFPLGLNHLLAERNGGKLILRIADTNPDNIYPEAYHLLESDAKWLTHDNISEVIIQSDRMELYYEYAEKMLAEGWAYICTCSADNFRELVNNKQACDCRSLAPSTNLERWELMLQEYEPGDAVMRIKTDITHKNPAMRDFPLMRINLGNHPRQGTKYRVWPLMNFSVSVDDMESGMTHVLRAKDHADNAKRQEYMYNFFHKPIPTVYNVGKINFTDLKLSTSETRKKVKEGLFNGWDDIRLPFLPSLRRRGFQSETFLRLADEVGISATDKTLSKDEYFKQIESFNKDIIDKISERAFFVRNPAEITILNAPETVVKKDLHPTENKGGREFTVEQTVYVESEDLENPEGIVFRLMDAYNFTYSDGEWKYHSSDVEEFKQAEKKRIIHFLPKHHAIDASLHMPDGSWIHGKVEPFVGEKDVDELLQFERVGFVRLDNTAPLHFWFAHR